MLQPGTHAVSLSQRVLLHCPVEGGDPPPVIHWTKEGRPVEIGHRIQQLANGSLVIYDSTVGYFLHPCTKAGNSCVHKHAIHMRIRSHKNQPVYCIVVVCSMSSSAGFIAFMGCVPVWKVIHPLACVSYVHSSLVIIPIWMLLSYWLTALFGATKCSVVL